MIQDLIDQVKLYLDLGRLLPVIRRSYRRSRDIMLDNELNYWDVAAVVPVIEGAKGVICGTGKRKSS